MARNFLTFPTMIMGRITSKAQTTVPLAVRRALGVGPGDTIGYEINGSEVTLRRVTKPSLDPLINPYANFTEWADDYDRVYDVLAKR